MRCLPKSDNTFTDLHIPQVPTYCRTVGRNTVCVRQTMPTTTCTFTHYEAAVRPGWDQNLRTKVTVTNLQCLLSSVGLDSSSGTKADLQCLCLQVRRMADQGGRARKHNSKAKKQKKSRQQQQQQHHALSPPQRLRPIIATHTYAAPDLSLRHHANAQTRYLPMGGPCHGQIYLPTLKNGMGWEFANGRNPPHLPTKP